jgi:hypothetical protein
VSFDRRESALKIAPHEENAMPRFSNTKWKFGGVTIADEDPATAMNLQQRHAFGGSRLRRSVRC